jgi:hypothetical protein
MPFNVTAQNTALDALDESATAGIKFAGIHTLVDPGTATTANAGEASGGSPAYARLAVTLAAAASGQKTGSSGILTFDVPAGTYGFITLWNASSGNTVGNYQGYIPFGGASALKGFGTVDTTLTTDTLFSRGHGMSNGDRVQLFNVFAETLPTGLAEGTIYYVVGSATDTFQVSTTLGGAAVDITAVGGGEFFWQRVVPEMFAAQGQITVAANALILDATAM